LSEPLAASLEAIRRTLEPPDEFDPAVARRTFVLGAVDTTQAVVLPGLLEFLSHNAPGIEVSTAPIRSTEEVFALLASGERDFAIGRFESPADGIHCERLYSDRIVCLARGNHPRIRGKLTMKNYLAESHLAQEEASPLERPFTIESLLAAEGLNRHVACRVENLAMAPLVVARTDLLCSAPEKTIAPFAKGLNLRVMEPPFDAPAFGLQIVWHERNDRDGGHLWFRERLRELFKA
jgi:DNA-binding transcriptional LysR family regulator